MAIITDALVFPHLIIEAAVIFTKLLGKIQKLSQPCLLALTSILLLLALSLTHR